MQASRLPQYKAAESGLEIMNISSIDPIKSLALEAGWNGFHGGTAVENVCSGLTKTMRKEL